MQPQIATPQLSKQARLQYLTRLQNWQIDGKLGVRDRDTGHNLSIEWQHSPHDFKLRLFSPFVSDSAEITGQAGKVMLITSEGDKFTSTDPGQLIFEHLGWDLPFAKLEYWIKGLPDPSIPVSAASYDQYNQLISLKQGGWDIEYQSYQAFNDISLPNKIVINNRQLHFKIIINQWQK